MRQGDFAYATLHVVTHVVGGAQLTVTEFLHRRTLVIHSSDDMETAQAKNEALIHSLVPAFLAKVSNMAAKLGGLVCLFVFTVFNSAQNR
jgi:hypothetical protein